MAHRLAPQTFSALALGAGFVVLGSGILGIHPAVAQTPTDILQDTSVYGDGDRNDPFEATTPGSAFDLFHRMNLSNSRSSAEFAEDQRENLSTEASDFRTRQLELLQQETMTSPASTDPTDTPDE